MKNILMFSDENNIKVKEIIKDSIKQIPDTDLIFNDLQKQEDEFQKKLQERRRVNSWNKKHQNPDHFSHDQSSQEIALKSNNLSSGNLAGSENTSANNVNVDGNEDFFMNKMDENLSPRGFDNKDEKQTPTQQESKNEDQTLTPIKDDNISDIKDTVSTDMILTRNQTEQPKKFKQHRKHQSMFVLPDKVHEEVIIVLKRVSPEIPGKSRCCEGHKGKDRLFLVGVQQLLSLGDLPEVYRAYRKTDGLKVQKVPRYQQQVC